VPALGVGQVVSREVLQDNHVRHEPGAAQQPFEQIVAEQGVLGNAACQTATKGGTVHDPFSDVAPLPEEVLVQIGNRLGVKVQATVAGKKPRRIVLLTLVGLTRTRG